MISNLGQLVESGFEADISSDCFGDILEDDFCNVKNNTVKGYLRELGSIILVILNRQYGSYLDLSEEELDVLYAESG